MTDPAAQREQVKREIEQIVSNDEWASDVVNYILQREAGLQARVTELERECAEWKLIATNEPRDNDQRCQLLVCKRQQAEDERDALLAETVRMRGLLEALPMCIGKVEVKQYEASHEIILTSDQGIALVLAFGVSKQLANAFVSLLKYKQAQRGEVSSE
jgi:hypothetical protein